jgi:hypothetical protein
MTTIILALNIQFNYNSRNLLKEQSMKKIILYVVTLFNFNLLGAEIGFRLGSINTFGQNIPASDYEIVRVEGISSTQSSGVTFKMKGCYKEKTVSMEDYPFHINYIPWAAQADLEVSFQGKVITIEDDISASEKLSKAQFKKQTSAFCQSSTNTYVKVVVEHEGFLFDALFLVERKGGKYYTKDILEKLVLLGTEHPIDFFVLPAKD